MGNVCETLCCGYVMPKNDDNLESINEDSMPRSSNIFTIYSPIDYEPFVNEFKNDESNLIIIDLSLNKSKEDDDDEFIECKKIVNNNIRVLDFIENYFKKTFITFLPSYKFTSIQQQNNLQFFQTTKSDEKLVEKSSSIIMNVLSYLKPTNFISKFLVRPKPIELGYIAKERENYGLKPFSEFLLRMNDFNFL
jgi:hypothetical protein